MGLYATAKIAYGYDISDYPESAEFDSLQEQEIYDDFGDFAEERLLDRLGGFTTKYEEDHPPEYWVRRREAQEKAGVEMEYYGHYDGGTQYFLAIPKPKIEADIGAAVGFTLGPTYPEWDRQIRAGLEALGIAPTRKIGWHLMVSYG